MFTKLVRVFPVTADYGASGKNANTLTPAKGTTVSTSISNGAGSRSQDAESHDDAAGDDDMLEAVIRSAASAPVTRQRERRRARNSDRKSCKALTVRFYNNDLRV